MLPKTSNVPEVRIRGEGSLGRYVRTRFKLRDTGILGFDMCLQILICRTPEEVLFNHFRPQGRHYLCTWSLKGQSETIFVGAEATPPPPKKKKKKRLWDGGPTGRVLGACESGLGFRVLGS